MSTPTVTCVGLTLSLLAAAGARLVPDGARPGAIPTVAAGLALGSRRRVGSQAVGAQAMGACA